MQYKRRVEVVEAVQYDGTNAAQVIALNPALFKMSEDGSQLLYDVWSNGEQWSAIDIGMWAMIDAFDKLNVWDQTFYKYWQPGGQVSPTIARYQPKAIPSVEAVLWNGANFSQVQTVCPQAARFEASDWFNIPTMNGPIEVHVGEVVVRDLATGKCSKMQAELFSNFYEAQIL